MCMRKREREREKEEAEKNDKVEEEDSERKAFNSLYIKYWSYKYEQLHSVNKVKKKKKIIC